MYTFVDSSATKYTLVRALSPSLQLMHKIAQWRSLQVQITDEKALLLGTVEKSELFVAYIPPLLQRKGLLRARITALVSYELLLTIQ